MLMDLSRFLFNRIKRLLLQKYLKNNTYEENWIF